MTAFRETERISQQEPRGQGDIIKIEWRGNEDGPQYGVVINADCDLAWGRTDGVIAFVPLYSFYDYLALFWASGHVQNVVSTETAAVLQLAGDSDSEALHEWIRLSGANEVSCSIKKYKSLKKKEAEKLERSLRHLAICLDHSQTYIARFRSICAVASDPSAYARTQIANAKKALGDGHFFISDLVDDPSVGFVVRLRRIYTLPEQDCFISISDQMARSEGDRVTAARVARLTERYRFKILQLFAQQYSRIGLNDDVTALSDLAVEDLVEKITGEKN
ncbi:MAG: hypothetical protein ACK4PN_07880 [Allorhizobium sp.]